MENKLPIANRFKIMKIISPLFPKISMSNSPPIRIKKNFEQLQQDVKQPPMTSREINPIEKLKKTIGKVRSAKRFTNQEQLPKLSDQEEKQDKSDGFEFPKINEVKYDIKDQETQIVVPLKLKRKLKELIPLDSLFVERIECMTVKMSSPSTKLKKEPKKPIEITPQQIFRQYSNSVKIISKQSLLKPFILIVDLECLGLSDDSLFGYDQQKIEIFQDIEVKRAFNRVYTPVGDGSRLKGSTYIYNDLKDKIMYMKKLFTVILMVKKRNQQVDRVLEHVSSWFDTIIDIHHLQMKRDYQAIIVDYTSIIEDLSPQGFKRIVVFQTVDLKDLDLPKYLEKHKRLGRLSVQAIEFGVMMSGLNEGTIEDPAYLNTSLPWFDCDSSKLRVVLMQRRGLYQTMMSMLQRLNSPNFIAVYGIQRLESAIIAQFNDLQLYSFLTKNICYRLNLNSAMEYLRVERQHTNTMNRELVTRRRNYCFESKIRSNNKEKLTLDLQDSRSQFMLKVPVEFKQMADSIFERNESNQLNMVEKKTKIQRVLVKNEQHIHSIDYDFDYVLELQNQCLFMAENFD